MMLLSSFEHPGFIAYIHNLGLYCLDQMQTEDNRDVILSFKALSCCFPLRPEM